VFVVGAVVVILLIASGAWSFCLAKLNCQVDAKLAEIRKAGYPVTLEELDAWYPYPEGENAADVYEEAFAALVDPDSEKLGDLPVVGGGTLPELGEPLPPDMQKRIGEFVAANAEAITILHRAAAIKGCRFKVDLSLGVDAMLPHLGKLRECSMTLALAALLAAEEGRGDGVTEAIRSGLAVGHSLGNEPDLISQLVRIACFSITTHNLQSAMNRTTLTPEQCADLAERLRAADAPDALVRAMAAERCRFHACLLPEGDAWQDEWWKGDSTGWRISSRFARATGGSVRARLLWLEVTERYINAFRAPESELYRKATAVETAAISELEQDTRRLTGVSARIILMVLPSYRRWVAADLKCRAQLRTARTALAVEQFRQANGRLPKTLDELVPKYLDAVPPDPFDGKPLRYKRLEKGYVVYSIGPNETDDAGADLAKLVSGYKGDVTFHILR